MLFGTIASSSVTEEFDFVERGIKVYPVLELAIEARKEGESIFACMAMPHQVMPPDVISPDTSYALLGIPKAKAIIIDEETRGLQSISTRVAFLCMLIHLFEKQTEAFANNGIALTSEPFINPFTMNSLYKVLYSVVEDMATCLGMNIVLPEIKINIQRAESPILGADGMPTQSRNKIIC